jgi:hypothetical protein
MAGKAELDTVTDINPSAALGKLAAIDDPEQIQRAILERLMTAETVEQVLREDETVATKQLVGKKLRVTDARVMQSSFEGGLGVYLIADAIDLDTGELIVVNTGATKIVGQLIRLKQKGWLPVDVTIKEVGRAKEGQDRALQLAALG